MMMKMIYRLALMLFALFPASLLLDEHHDYWHEDFIEDNEKFGRISGGTASPPGSWPFMAAIYNFEVQRKFPSCGGVVWNEDTIITAAHCLVRKGIVRKESKLHVYLGHTNVEQGKLESKYLFDVKKIILHHDFDEKTFANDIAILRLSAEIDFEDTHTAVRCICEPEHIFERLNEKNCLAIGWGYLALRDEPDRQPNDLQQVPMPLMNRWHCAKHNGNYQYPQHLCAGWREGGRDTCAGDSGGPLMCAYRFEPQHHQPHQHNLPHQHSHEHRYSFAGITSHGAINCSQPNSPAYFTNVTNYMDWITENSGDDSSFVQRWITTNTTVSTA